MIGMGKLISYIVVNFSLLSSAAAQSEVERFGSTEQDSNQSGYICYVK